MTTGPRIRIINERVVSTFPKPGVERRRLSITYQLPPKPASTLIVDADLVADVKFRAANKADAIVPDEVAVQGDKDRRELILEHAARRQDQGVRTL